MEWMGVGTENGEGQIEKRLNGGQEVQSEL